MERKARAATQTGLYLIIVAAILVGANLISYTAYHRFDLTKNERFTLSDGSKRLVREGLNKELSIDIYVTRGLPKHEIFIQDLTDLMSEYETASEGKLVYSIIEAKTEEERAKAKEEGLQEAAFGEGSETGEDQATITRGFMGMVFKYGSEKETLPILSPDQAMGLEFWITNKIRELRDREDDLIQKFGVITGKDEIKLSDSNLIASQGGRPGPNLQGIMKQALPFYEIVEVDLQEGEAEIDQELSGVLITQPGKDYTDKELRRIDEFLMRGNKAVAIFAGAVNMKPADASMKGELNTRGLEKLLDGYGVEMKKEAILDWGRGLSIPLATQGGQTLWFKAPGIVQLQADDRFEDDEKLLDDSFAGFFRLPELAFPFPSPLVTHRDKQPEADMKVVARTTPRTTVDDAPFVDLKISADWQPKGEYGQRVIGVALEGTIKSAFDGAGESGITAPPKSAAPSRLLVVSSSQFLANPFARAGNPPPMPPQMQMMGGMGGDQDLQMLSQPYAQKHLTATILALKNTFDWMGGDTDLLAASAKLLGEPNLTYSDVEKPSEDITDDEETAKKKAEEYKQERKKVQQRVQWTLTFFPAGLFALFGIFRWRRRESMRGSVRI